MCMVQERAVEALLVMLVREWYGYMVMPWPGAHGPPRTGSTSWSVANLCGVRLVVLDAHRATLGTLPYTITRLFYCINKWMPYLES